MKYLLGSELAGFVKERQAKQVRQLLQQYKIQPKLAIVAASDNPTIKTYVTLKKKYGADIGVVVEEHLETAATIIDTINNLNNDDTVHGIIVQLPIDDISKTEEVLQSVIPGKDVDGLHSNSIFDAATPIAINWLLNGYNVDLKNKKIVIVGNGRLVGAPLNGMWQNSGLQPIVIDVETPNKEELITSADIIITAVGRPSLITSKLVKQGAIVVDAGVASEKGVLKGDVAEDVFDREDITITPKKGGVGPLTVCALFDNVIRSANNAISS